jgi:hypothetical protein
VRDLLGVAADAVGNWRTSLSAAQGGVSTIGVEQYETEALAVAAAAFADPGRRGRLLACADAAGPSVNCVHDFVTAFGRRAFRRPLTDDEVSRYVELAAAATADLGNAWAGPEMVAAAMLESPSFLYRVELGTDDGSGTLTYDGWELASRLSFMVWSTTPDDTLLDAAARGDLSTSPGLAPQIDRLLVAAQAADGLDQFLDDWLDLDSVSQLVKDSSFFPGFDTTLAASMQKEISLSLRSQLLEQGGDFRGVFDNLKTQLNGPLARLYGVSGVDGNDFREVALPLDGPRAGVLGFGGILALQASTVSTSPTLRGKFVRGTFLCQSIPPPPKGVNTQLPASDPKMPTTTRQRLEAHRSDPFCASCHGLMDPIGFGLEAFDAEGAFRTTENALPLDTRGTIDGVSFADARGLGQALKQNPKAVDCFVRQVYRYAQGHIEATSEARALSELNSQFSSHGYTYRTLMTSLALHPSFRLAAPTP